MIEHLGAALHPVALDGCAIAMVQVLAQTIQIATRAGLDLGRLRRWSAGSSLVDHNPVGGFLVPIFPLGQVRYGPPKRFFERAGCGLFEGERRAQLDLGRDVRAQIVEQTGRGGWIARQLRQFGQPGVEGSIFGDAKQGASERGRQGACEILTKIEQLAQVLCGGVAKLTRLARKQPGGLAMAWAIQEIRREHERAPAGGRDRFGCDGAESERVFMDFRLAAAGIEASEQGQVPEKLAGSRAHRRIVEAIAEPAAAVEQLGGVFQLSLARGLPVEQELVVMCPYLRVARHGLAV